MNTGAGASLSRGQRMVVTALVVCAAYYAGAQIGFQLQLPSLTTSVLWPPNAILTAILLLTRPRHWAVYLLAALPVHLLVEMNAGLPPALALAFFVTNCSEALLAAYGVRRLSDAPTRFDTLRRAVVFILAAVLFAPFASSFPDAGAVAWLRGEPYWLVWRTRFFSNALTALTLVPALVMAVTAGPAWIRGASWGRRLEAALLATGVLSVAIASFAQTIEAEGVASGAVAVVFAVPVLLPFLLGFLMWGAVRFGPGGASLCLVATVAIAISAATLERGPFVTLAPAESVFALQVFLTVLGIPLLCLAAAIEERRRADEALAERLRFEALLSRLSSTFVHPPSHEFDRAIEIWLRRLGEALGLDRITLRLFSEDKESLVVAHAWAGPGQMPPTVRTFTSIDYPWVLDQLRREQPVVIESLADFPEAAALDKDAFRRAAIKSDLILPLVAGDQVIGGLAFVTRVAERRWAPELVDQLRLVAEVLANALARKQTEDALRASEQMKSGILASLSSHVAVLDRDGRIVAVNESWERFASEDGGKDAAVGASYLDLHRRAAGEGAAHAGEALLGVEAVLAGSRAAFGLEYARRAPAGEQWFTMSVVPLKRPEGGAVVSHTDVTERKRAEMEAQRARQELAHFTRVSTMGEMTASLAHELNQPLAAILANAQAGQRFLAVAKPDIEELRAILGDIVADDRRAAEVIQRVRDLLRKGGAQNARLDLNPLIRDVVRLVGSDALIRNVSVALDLDPAAYLVTGDRVQLQQVVLNLLLNAMEAMVEGADGDRTLAVRTRGTEADLVQVSVQDSGPGLPAGTEEVVFEPFYSTKSAGMGMGLSIARSIVSAHGGTIWATANPARGATFHFTLPIARESGA